MDSYTFRDNTFFKEQVSTPSRRVQWEIGDSKQSAAFFPQFKSIFWDNESNFSIRDSADYSGATLTNRTDRVELATATRAARFYEANPYSAAEGGFEFELELLVKPASPVISFTIEHKGLRFAYQPTLTAGEIAKGTIRPAHVVG